MNQSKEMAKIAIKALEDKKSNDTRIIDIANVSVISDYFLIASGSNNNQVQAMADNVKESLGRAGFEPRQVEGYSSADWILMDYNDIIVHIFSDEQRNFYSLEKIWADGTELSMDEFLDKDVQK